VPQLRRVEWDSSTGELVVWFEHSGKAFPITELQPTSRTREALDGIVAAIDEANENLV